MPVPHGHSVNFPTNTERILGSVANLSEKGSNLIVQGVPIISNTGIAVFAIQTAGGSLIGYLTTTDKAARVFYALGFVCSSISAGSASMSAFAKSCNFDTLAMVTQANGYAFYTVAERSHLAALAKEGKVNQLKARKPYRGHIGTNSGNAGFIIPNVNGKYKIIIDSVVWIITIYGYSKFLIFVYRKTKNFIVKKHNTQNSRLIVSKTLKSGSSYNAGIISRIKSRIKKIRIFKTKPKVQFIPLY